MTSTTLSVSITSSDRKMQVASATDFEVGKVVEIEEENMIVTSVTGTIIGLFRGLYGTQAKAHVAGVAVHVGDPSEFPYQDVGAAGTGVTATEYVNGRHHITTLQFSDLALGSVTNANKAIGALVYTLPAGAILVKSAKISVAMYGSGATCDADTPDIGLGTTIGSGVQALLSGVGTAAENILTGQTADDCDGTAEVITLDCTLAIESTGDHTVYFNAAAGPWAGACDITATGTVYLEWVKL